VPVRYVIDKKRKLVLTTGEGTLTFEEIKSHQDRLLADTNLDPGFNQLIDLTAVKMLSLSAGEAEQLARRKVLSPYSQRAVVASEKSVYGMFRLMQTYHEATDGHSHVAIFYDRNQALQWLGVPVDSGLF